MKNHFWLYASSILALSISSAASVQAQSSGPESSLIDQQLLNGIDLRKDAFQVCLDTPVCTVEGLKIEGFHLDVNGVWHPQALYWDAIDGFGVTGSGQNDEIDFDEKLVITATRPVQVKGVWLSDLFIGEGSHYGATSKGKQDAESGQITLSSADGKTQAEVVVSGDKTLPDVSFNTVVYSGFEEGGDLLSRLLVSDNSVTIVGADHKEGAPVSASIGNIDLDKESIFVGVPTVERNDAELLALIDGVVLFPAGTRNAEMLSQLVSDSRLFQTLRENVQVKRTFGDIQNGEVLSMFDTPVATTTFTFMAPLGTSNDFSVAGFVVK
ncbi:MAG: hypothetical protein ABI832_13455 [bacterium]